MENTTLPMDYDGAIEYDYGGATPCNKEDVRALGAQLLPPLYSLVFVVGLVGNILVVLVLMQYKRLKSRTSVYLLNLAFSDLLFLFTLPFWIDYSLKDTWVFGNGMCKLLSGFYYVGLYSEIFFIILLTIDRYLALVHRMFVLRTQTVTFGVITSSIVWALAFLPAIPGFYFSKTQEEFTGCTCSLHFPQEHLQQWRQFQALKLNIVGLILPLAVMIVCYTRIIRILLRQPNEKKAKSVRLIFVIMLAFFLFWTPFNLTVFVSAFQNTILSSQCKQSKQLYLAIQVTEMIAYSHCCINPIIYVFIGQRFRKYLRQLFQRLLSMPLGKWQPFLRTNRQERASSMPPFMREQELSNGL
ncbi:C-C chemokine receptor type 1-like [Phyllostomus hastatus]|uniref:C-C chemokine receptor type 1-like n=1 Tax=Phyllostomus hastatus TaxID=9423 RepID=UPI001E681E11|nr:C-C chemokine receptor type 1-like [Phyllostomus hastatus]XP_045712530.1 C-C chemokine receptor type 1-like [Phyllostomus hastatus]XP_045712531.1 C-C chemokine receptor type 1-like [Phyllostomus hastatus]XP_045712532.1 C-C chemokine receptor type 1-like [Phyllostomus hastatus]XP_045712533.1 C-C chemokine receptor type 1-like [Phyllostomus hastatus]